MPWEETNSWVQSTKWCRLLVSDFALGEGGEYTVLVAGGRKMKAPRRWSPRKRRCKKMRKGKHCMAFLSMINLYWQIFFFFFFRSKQSSPSNGANPKPENPTCLGRDFSSCSVCCLDWLNNLKGAVQNDNAPLFRNVFRISRRQQQKIKPKAESSKSEPCAQVLSPWRLSSFITVFKMFFLFFEPWGSPLQGHLMTECSFVNLFATRWFIPLWPQGGFWGWMDTFSNGQIHWKANVSQNLPPS